MHEIIGEKITIADDVYNELVKVKGKKSFSEIVRSLIKKQGNSDILLIGFGSRNEREMREFKEELREVEEWMQSFDTSVVIEIFGRK